jgi:hypothetical protein
MDSTDLSELLGGAPVQSPAFQPMVTGGGDPFSTPLNTSPHKTPPPDYSRQFSAVRGSFRSVLGYLSFFLGVFIMSLSKPRDLLLPYVPNTRGESGMLTYTGAAVISGASVVLSYVINTVFHTLI